MHFKRNRPSHLLVMGASAVTFSSLAFGFFCCLGLFISSLVFFLSVGIEIVVERDLESSDSIIPKYVVLDWLE